MYVYTTMSTSDLKNVIELSCRPPARSLRMRLMLNYEHSLPGLNLDEKFYLKLFFHVVVCTFVHVGPAVCYQSGGDKRVGPH